MLPKSPKLIEIFVTLIFCFKRILRKRFKAEVIDSWASTKYREPLSKLIAEIVKTVKTTLLWIAIIVFLLLHHRCILLGVTSGVHIAIPISDRNMGTKVVRGHQHEQLLVIWKNDTLLMVLQVHVERQFRTPIKNLAPFWKNIVCL